MSYIAFKRRTFKCVRGSRLYYSFQLMHIFKRVSKIETEKADFRVPEAYFGVYVLDSDRRTNSLMISNLPHIQLADCGRL